MTPWILGYFAIGFAFAIGFRVLMIGDTNFKEKDLDLAAVAVIAQWPLGVFVWFVITLGAIIGALAKGLRRSEE